jgi:hypothetical protein
MLCENKKEYATTTDCIPIHVNGQLHTNLKFLNSLVFVGKERRCLNVVLRAN